jgi:hypothetical protein
LKESLMRATPLLCLMVSLGLASAGLKAAAAPATAPTAVPAAAPSGAAITVTLKDGQRADLFLKSYDNFFLTALNSVGTRFDLPWSDVAAVDSTQAGADLALMRGKITDEPATTEVLVEPRSRGTAVVRALWPGVLIHGAGFDYAGDKGIFYDLAGAEVFGIAVAALGGYLDAYPNTEDSGRNTPSGGQDLIIGGAAVFGVSWLWDICFSPGAASDTNAAKGLALEPASNGGAQLAYHF